MNSNFRENEQNCLNSVVQALEYRIRVTLHRLRKKCYFEFYKEVQAAHLLAQNFGWRGIRIKVSRPSIAYEFEDSPGLCKTLMPYHFPYTRKRTHNLQAKHMLSIYFYKRNNFWSNQLTYVVVMFLVRIRVIARILSSNVIFYKE